jgi:hypothetical protein
MLEAMARRSPRVRALAIASGAVSSIVLAASSAIVGVACGSFSSADDGVVDASGDDASGDANGDAGVSPDAAAPAPGDAAVTSDGAPVSSSGVYCGAGRSCDPQTEVCCEHLVGGGVGCLPVAMRDMCQGLDLGCDDSADCAYLTGGICCGIHDSTRTMLQTTSCATLQNCMTQGFWVVVCDQSAAAGTACPGGAGCHVPEGGTYGFCDGLISAQ